MVVITKKKNESKDSMFRKFTRTFINERVQDEVRERLFYLRPSQQKKEDEKKRRKSRRR